MSPEHAHANLAALARVEAARTPTPGVTRWFVVLHYAVTTARETIRMPRLAFHR
jgi:hypothetical protein